MARLLGLDAVDILVLVALLVCLIPTTIGALLSAIGIAGMDRLVQRNVLAMTGRAVEAAGDVDTLLLDKTGTITYRQPPGDRVRARWAASTRDELRRAAGLAVAGRRDARGELDRRAAPGRGVAGTARSPSCAGGRRVRRRSPPRPA